MMAEQRCGQAAGELVSNLLLQGHTTTKDLAKAYLAVAKTGRNETMGGGGEERRFTAVNLVCSTTDSDQTCRFHSCSVRCDFT